MAPLAAAPYARGKPAAFVVYGIAMGCMNFCFYSALSRIPLGIAVAMEFTGPLAVAIAASHRALDYLWVRSGGARPSRAAASGSSVDVRRSAVAFALGAGVCWALYIVFGQKAGAAHGGVTTAIGTARRRAS